MADHLFARARVASSCPVPWSELDRRARRVRFCDPCGHFVYRFEGMTSAEAQALIVRTEGRPCSRLHRRRDGSMLTSACPRSGRGRRRAAKVAALALAGAVWALGLVALASSSPTSQYGFSEVATVGRWMQGRIQFLGSAEGCGIDTVDSNL